MSPVARLHIEATLSGVSAVSLRTPRTDEVLSENRPVKPLFTFVDLYGHRLGATRHRCQRPADVLPDVVMPPCSLGRRVSGGLFLVRVISWLQPRAPDHERVRERAIARHVYWLTQTILPSQAISRTAHTFEGSPA
jgi:hypothetical protein